MNNFKLLLRFLLYRIIDIIKGNTGYKDKFSRERGIYPFRLLIHPIGAFNDLKYENKSSVPISFIMALLFFLTRILDQTATSILFSENEAGKFSLTNTLFTSAGILLVWSICNWATCTLAGGEGTFRDVWIVSAYSFLPYCMFVILSVILSHAFSLNEGIFYHTIRGIGNVWTGILLFLGLLIVHQYTVLKTIISTILTIIMIILCCFLAMLMFSIVQQIYGFTESIIRELLI